MEKEITAIFDQMVTNSWLFCLTFGKHLAIDGKKLLRMPGPIKRKSRMTGARDTDADFGKKVYRGKREDGTCGERWSAGLASGLHLVVDSNMSCCGF